MNKKIIITTLVFIMVMAAAGTAMAGNGFGESVSGTENVPVEGGLGSRFGASAEKGSGQEFAQLAGEYETQEELHEAVLAMKLEMLDSKVADGSITQEEADAMAVYLTACEGDCDAEGMNPERPEEGFGIFGRGAGTGTKSEDGNGYRGGNGGRAGERLQDCDAE